MFRLEILNFSDLCVSGVSRVCVCVCMGQLLIFPRLGECPVAPGHTYHTCGVMGGINHQIPAFWRLMINPGGFAAAVHVS